MSNIQKVSKEEFVVSFPDTTLPYEKHVANIKNDICNNRKRTLKCIWEAGAFVNLLKQSKAYGEKQKTVEDFIKDMEDMKVSKSEVYKWAKFSEMYTPAQVNELIDVPKIGWGVVTNLLRVKDDTSRKAIEEQVQQGELPVSKVPEVVSALNQQQKEQEKGPSCHRGFSKINTALQSVLKHTSQCAKDIQDLSLILNEEGKYERAVDIMQQFQQLETQVSAALEDLTNELNKTI
jgi:hypothetical protein